MVIVVRVEAFSLGRLLLVILVREGNASRVVWLLSRISMFGSRVWFTGVGVGINWASRSRAKVLSLLMRLPCGEKLSGTFRNGVGRA